MRMIEAYPQVQFLQALRPAAPTSQSSFTARMEGEKAQACSGSATALQARGGALAGRRHRLGEMHASARCAALLHTSGQRLGRTSMQRLSGKLQAHLQEPRGAPCLLQSAAPHHPPAHRLQSERVEHRLTSTSGPMLTGS